MKFSKRGVFIKLTRTYVQYLWLLIIISATGYWLGQNPKSDCPKGENLSGTHMTLENISFFLTSETVSYMFIAL